MLGISDQVIGRCRAAPHISSVRQSDTIKKRMNFSVHPLFTSYFLHLHPSSLHFILQNQRQDYTDNADDQSAEERIPPNGLSDYQRQSKGLTDDARQPEQEGVD